MTIREHINISDDKLMNGLLPVVRLMSEINASKDSEVTLDFSDTKFVSPVFILFQIGTFRFGVCKLYRIAL